MGDIGPERLDDDQRFLKELDEDLRLNSGQTIAWLSVENQIESYADPGPNTTKDYYFFNIGVLPQEAHLEPYIGVFKFPIEKSVRVPFWNPLDDELSWDMDLQDTLSRGMAEPEIVIRPEIFVADSKIAILSRLREISTPRPAIGNAAVEELFDRHNLEQIPKVADALTMLRAWIEHQVV